MSQNDKAIEIAEITAMMSTESGRNVIRRILEYTNVWGDTYSNDTHNHAYNAGKRKVGLHIIDELQMATPDYFMKLLEERNGD